MIESLEISKKKKKIQLRKLGCLFHFDPKFIVTFSLKLLNMFDFNPKFINVWVKCSRYL